MQLISSSEARNNLSAVIDQAQNEPVTIQKQGRNTAVLISYAEYERLTHGARSAFQALCDEIGAHAKVNGLDEATLADILKE